jgi:KUP system potassium uptake protein
VTNGAEPPIHLDSASNGHTKDSPGSGHDSSNGHAHGGIVALSLGALGVVYGDIGTSPLYSLREAFHDDRLEVNEANVLGACSLVFWSLLIVITVKYLLLVMRADNRGEGGILALTSLVVPAKGYRQGKRRAGLIMLGLFGCALLYGDGVITPAISVLSAVEGLKVKTSIFNSWVIPISIVILILLFLVQRRGTAGIGKVFGPIMMLWFSILALLGVFQIAKDPSIIRSVNPKYAIDYFSANGYHGFLSLGSIFLVVTGGEALYADMGHFGRKPIGYAWLSMVLPALLLNYWGQGVLLIKNPEAIENPLFLMGPSWTVLPMVFLATMATVIASQALISGAFSLTAQAVQLDYLPRLSITHTSDAHAGQIYVPFVNWILMLACIGTVIAFKTSSALAAAYGIAVTSTMAVTTILFGAVAYEKWKWSKAKVLAICTPLFLIDLAFLGANIPKIPKGGWFPLAIGFVLVLTMSTWKKGRELVAARIKRAELPIHNFISREVPTLTRVPGTAVFLFKDPFVVPPAMVTCTRLNKSIHQTVLLITVQTAEAPRVPLAERAVVTSLPAGFHQVELLFGFMEDPDVPAALSALIKPGFRFEPEDTTYFLGRETVTSAAGDGMAQWRENLFAMQNSTASSAGRFFGLPTSRVFEVGSQVQI